MPEDGPIDHPAAKLKDTAFGLGRLQHIPGISRLLAGRQVCIPNDRHLGWVDARRCSESGGYSIVGLPGQPVTIANIDIHSIHGGFTHGPGSQQY